MGTGSALLSDEWRECVAARCLLLRPFFFLFPPTIIPFEFIPDRISAVAAQKTVRNNKSYDKRIWLIRLMVDQWGYEC